MKMKKEHFDYISQKINALLDEKGRDVVISAYESGNFPRSEKVRSLQTRFNIDLFYAAGLSGFACDTLYKYLHDTHIDTALKKICPKIERKY